MLRRVVRLSTLEVDAGMEDEAGLVQRRRNRLCRRNSARWRSIERCLISYCCRCCLEVKRFLIFSLKRSANDKFWTIVDWMMGLVCFFFIWRTRRNRKNRKNKRNREKEEKDWQLIKLLDQSYQSM